MDGTIANLKEICDLAEKYSSMVMVDECHAAGFLGKTGRGTPEYHGVMDRIDIITGTLGKALGGGSGGYVTGRQAIVDLLRQRSRPYLFSNSLTPCTVAASIKAIEIASRSTELRDRLEENTQFFRSGSGGKRVEDPAGHSSDRSGHDRRRGSFPKSGESTSRFGNICRGFLLSGGATRDS